MGTLYCDTGGSATNSGSNDGSALLSGTAATAASTVVTLDGSPNLSALITSGATQSSIYLSQASNSNRKIFWITAFDDTLKTVTVDVAPTGITSSAWTIGGRFILTNASQEGALRAGDTLIINNSPATQATSCWVFRNAGDSTSGFAKVMGKSGVRPVLTCSGNNVTTVSFGVGLCWLENLEVKQSNATNGTAITNSGNATVIYNVKVSQAAAGAGISLGGGGCRYIACEVTGCALDGIVGGQGGSIIGCYIHDNTGDGIELNGANTSMLLLNNVIDTNGGRGIFVSASVAGANAILCHVINNTVYNNGNSGLEVSDADYNLVVFNNIFMNNGNASGEYNVEWAAGTAEYVSFHGWNDFNTAQAGGSDNLLNLTANAQVAASEITTDPLMTNPASGDFSITINSPAFNVGFPGQLLGATSLGHMDLGAQQAQTPVGILNSTP